MALSSFRLTDDIFNSQLIHTSGGLRNSLVVYPDPENMGIAVGIALLTCIEAEIHVKSFLLPIYGRHLRFLPNLHVGQSRSSLIIVARPRKHGYSRWNLLSCIRAEIYAISYVLPPERRAVIPLVSTCCLTPKTQIQPLEFRCHHAHELRYTLFPMCFQLMAAIFDFQHTQSSDSILTSLSMLPDPKNVGIAVGISLLSCVEAEIRAIEFTEPPS